MCYYDVVIDIKYILITQESEILIMKLSKLQKQMIKNMKEIEYVNNSPYESLKDLPPLKNVTIDEAIKREELYLDSLEDKESEMLDEYRLENR